MKIKRELKYASWEYDEDTGEIMLSIINPADPERPDIQRLTMNRTYAFSLARFFLRVFQRMSMKRRKKAIHSDESSDQVHLDFPDEMSES